MGPVFRGTRSDATARREAVMLALAGATEPLTEDDVTRRVRPRMSHREVHVAIAALLTEQRVEVVVRGTRSTGPSTYRVARQGTLFQE